MSDANQNPGVQPTTRETTPIWHPIKGHVGKHLFQLASSHIDGLIDFSHHEYVCISKSKYVLYWMYLSMLLPGLGKISIQPSNAVALPARRLLCEFGSGPALIDCADQWTPRFVSCVSGPFLFHFSSL